MKTLITLAFTLSLSLALQAYGQPPEGEGAESSYGSDYSIIDSLVGDETFLSEIYADQDSDDNDPVEDNINLDITAPDLMPETKALQSGKTLRPKCGLPPSLSYQTLDRIGADLVDNCTLEATFGF